ncbi:MAG: hypothetical protein ACRC1F_02815 [Metamycoplasmataceae bacterium]
MNSKIKYLNNSFLQHKYHLNEMDIVDLEKQLVRKPIQIYLMAIEWLAKKEYPISYNNVKKLIKTDIKIRNDVRNIITSLEESIRVIYLDNQINEDSFYNFKEFQNKSKKSLNYIIDKDLKNSNTSEVVSRFNKIRKIRNMVGHLAYLVIFDKIDIVLKELNDIRNLKNIDKEVFDSYIDSINNNLNNIENFDV